MDENVLRVDRPRGSPLEPKVRATRAVAWAQRVVRRRPALAAVGCVAAAAVVVVGIVTGPPEAGLTAAALAAALLAYARPALVGPLVALLLPTGYKLVAFGAHVSVFEAVVGGAGLGYGAYLVARPRERRFALAHGVFAVFVCFVGLSMLAPADDSSQLRAFLFWAALGFVFHAVTTHLDDRWAVRLLLAGLATAVLAETTLASYEYVSTWSERFHRLGGAIVYPLPFGTLYHPNALAMFFVFALLLLLALRFTETGRLRGATLVIAAAGSLALVVTFSRASWIAFTAGAFVYLLDRRTRVPALLTAAVAAGGVGLAILDGGAIGSRITSLFSASSSFTDFRVELAEKAARLAADHPLTGAGDFWAMGVYAGRLDFAQHPHNLFLGLAVFFGIPAAVAFGALIVLALRAARSGILTCTGAERRRAVGFLAFLVAVIVNGLFEYPLWSPPLTALIVLGLAIVIALDPAPRRERVFARR